MTAANGKSRAGAARLSRGAGFVLRLGWRLDRRRLVWGMLGMWSGYLAGPLSALAIAAFTNAARRHRSGSHFFAPRPGEALILALIVAALLVAQLMLAHF